MTTTKKQLTVFVAQSVETRFILRLLSGAAGLIVSFASGIVNILLPKIKLKLKKNYTKEQMILLTKYFIF